jgi:hypothetical protein
VVIRRLSFRIFAACGVMLLLLAHASASADYTIYVSPGDDGVPAASTPEVPTDESVAELPLYIVSNEGDGSSGDAKCSGHGTGSEVCAWSALISASGGVSIAGFDSGAADVVLKLEADGKSMRANGLDAIAPDQGPSRMGLLAVIANAPGEVTLVSGQGVGSMLTLAAAPAAVLAVTGDAPADDSDGDGVPDDGDGSGTPGDSACASGETVGCDDNCPDVANGPSAGDNVQLDSDGDGVGDVCECGYVSGEGVALTGDANRDGSVDGADYTLWADNFGGADVDFGRGDFNCDGAVDGADYTLWADNFGAEADPGAGSGAGSAGDESQSTSAVLGCGLGFELLLIAPLLIKLRGRRRLLRVGRHR